MTRNEQAALLVGLELADTLAARTIAGIDGLEAQICNANALLAEAADLFRQYEYNHRLKAMAAWHAGEDNRHASHMNKARTNCNVAARIEAFLSETGQA